MRKLSQLGISLLKQLEGLRLEAYPDSGGIWTVGYGHTGPEVTPISKITEQTAEVLLLSDVSRTELGVSELVTVEVSSNEFSALVIFSYNIGLTAFRLSQLLSLLNRGYSKDLVAQEFNKWIHVGTTIVPGLVARRAAEAKLFLTPDLPQELTSPTLPTALSIVS